MELLVYILVDIVYMTIGGFDFMMSVKLFNEKRFFWAGFWAMGFINTAVRMGILVGKYVMM